MDHFGHDMDHSPSWNSFSSEFERKCEFLEISQFHVNLKSKFILAREMREESERFFTFFWIVFGLMVLAAILMSLKKMCDAADEERNRRRLRSACGNWMASQPVYPHTGRNHRSSSSAFSPYEPTVIDMSNHSYIPGRINEVSSAPKDHGSVLADLPPAYDDVVRSNNTHSSEHMADSHHSSADHTSSNHCTDHTRSDVSCSADIGSSSTND